MPPGGYGAPRYGYGQPEAYPAQPPPVWRWYVAYAIAMAAMYLLVTGFGVFLVVAGESDGEKLEGFLFAGICLVLAVVFGAAPFLAKRPGAWTYHLVLICLGMTSACCMAASIPLLIHWLKPETKEFFGRV